ncbi:SapC family protein [Xenophilus sp. Marseille-Q4582]|uniref:SapC family protein n=1 Tax=Xenophilus sp. Marseille-Q4582 TaxID=2866600 RepID=UPI001CE3BB4D|nr:SapC family protein [Xenophilus sp. Marseille-Q4582]
MFNNHVPFNKERHRDLRFTANQPYHFAAKEMLIPIVASEVQIAAREYTIVFPVESGGVPQVLTGVEAGVNAYVAQTGHWVGRYVPAHVRRYPFILVDAPASQQASESGERSYSLHVVPDAPHLNSPSGALLLNEAGEATPALEQVFKALKSLHLDHERTQLLTQQIEEAGLLVAQGIQVKNKDGKVSGLKGFRIVDSRKLAELDAETLGRLHRSGALALAYAQLLSLSNLRDGVLARATKPGAAPAAGAVPAEGGEINFEGVDWAKLFPKN